MHNDPYEAPHTSSPYVTREDARGRPAGMPSANPNEQPLMVPKRFGVGYSFNWNNPRAVSLFLAIIGGAFLVILLALLLPVLLLHH
jgi:uncharacterized membrane protein